MKRQYVLIDERKFDFDYIDANVITYEVQPELVELPENVNVHSEITDRDIQEGIRNARPVFL